MDSQLPLTPGRGRSRYSKALPVPPPPAEPKVLGLASTLQTKYSTSSDSTPRYSPLPPLPSDAPAPKKTIPRRPIGGGVKPVPSVDEMPSRESSSSSVYSDTPGLPGNASISSDKGRENDFSSSLTSPVSEDDILDLYTSVEETSPSTILSSPTSGLQKSPPRPEIWRRRSQKSDKNISVSDLKIEKSNGSTASPPSRTQPAAGRELPSAPSQLPRSKASTAVPGRKPVPLRPAPPQPTTMGGSLAKLRKKLSSNALADTFSKSLATDKNVATDQQPFTLPLHRSPTPEAEKTDLKFERTSIPKVLSPAPPHTPPEDASTTATAAPPAPVVPQKSRARKPLGEATMFSKAKSMSDLSINSSTSGTGTLSTSTIRPIAPPSTTSPIQQQRSPAPTSPLPPLPPASISLSSLPFQLRAPTGKLPSPPAAGPSSSTTSPPAIASPSTQTQAQTLQPPNITFPTIPAKDKAPEGHFFSPPPLDFIHFTCYHGHNAMRPSQNKTYPLLCMVCRKPEPGSHFRCAWCCLRCCNNCMQVLSSIPGRDLKTCLDQVVGEGEGEKAKSAAEAEVGPSYA